MKKIFESLRIHQLDPQGHRAACFGFRTAVRINLTANKPLAISSVQPRATHSNSSHLSVCFKSIHPSDTSSRVLRNNSQDNLSLFLFFVVCLLRYRYLFGIIILRYVF